MDSIMKLTLLLLLLFSGVLLFSTLYYAANYSEDWKKVEYSNYVETMNRIASPIAFFVIILIPVCTLKKIRRDVASFSLIIAGLSFILASIDYRFALAFASIVTLVLLVAYVKKNLASTLIHSGVALFILDFVLFTGSLHIYLFYLSSLLYLLGLGIRFYLR